ncbi:hypothetical protein ACA910_010771 [Epithemia clementina (nom. ined.)]
MPPQRRTRKAVDDKAYGDDSMNTRNRQTNISTFLPAKAVLLSSSARHLTATKAHHNRQLKYNAKRLIKTDGIQKTGGIQKHAFGNASQLYLDFGQKSFAQNTVCRTCGMLFVHGVAADNASHLRICRSFAHGIPFRYAHHAARSILVQPNSDKENQNVIVEVRSTDPITVRKKAEAVREIAHKELGFVANDESKCIFRTTFLFVKNGHIIGLLAVEPVREAYPLLLSNLERSCSSVHATMGVHTIWVLAHFRGQSVASQLLDVARTKFLYGPSCLPTSEIAFSSPTEAGIAFASRYIWKSKESTENAHILVYDCY